MAQASQPKSEEGNRDVGVSVGRQLWQSGRGKERRRTESGGCPRVFGPVEIQTGVRLLDSEDGLGGGGGSEEVSFRCI
jgi:hypothetical protein